MEIKKILLVLGVLILIFTPIAGRYVYASKYVRAWDGKICPRCTVRNIDISGKTREEAIDLLRTGFSYIQDKKIILRLESEEHTLSYKDLMANHNIDEIVDRALDYGLTSDLYDRLSLIKNPVERNFDLQFSYNKEPIEKLASELEKKIDCDSSDATIKIEKPGCFTITDEVLGKKLDKKQLYDSVVEKINDLNSGDTVLDVKVEYIIPTITAEKLKQINARVSSFSTYYGGSPPGRAANIELTVKLLNGKLLMPGEIFSFNETTGPRIEKKGYQTAPVIIKNKLVDGIGGGVCQVSTTLYNAIIRCNLSSISRVNHTLTPAYVPPGFDATVSSEIDYKFKNTLEFPILIEGFTNKGNVYFNIYSNSALANTKYDLVSEIYETNVPETIYKKDPLLPIGKVEKEETPHVGYKVRVYIVGYKNGKEISRKLISKDVYSKVDGVYRVGETVQSNAKVKGLR
jgi:vancomycin resistance protein YoaR